MTRTIARLILSLVAMLAAPVVYFITLVIFAEAFRGFRFTEALAWSTIITFPMMTVVWIVLWAGAIRWTTARVNLTIGVWLASTVVSAVLGLLIGAGFNEDELGWVCGGMVWLILWLAGSTWVWRESKSERLNRVKALGTSAIACPSCGYNMTGLREARCPECGSQFTLDQLFASLSEQHAELN